MLKTKQDDTRTVAEIVRDDYRTADVFKKYGINFCCGGKVPLTEACAARNIRLEELAKELEFATRNISVSTSLQFNQWKIEFLVDYIINVHHAYLKQALPAIEVNLLTFINSHRKNHPELPDLYDAFVTLSVFLQKHNLHEEEIIFPYIKQIDNAYRRKETYGNLFVRTLRKPLYNIEQEHGRIHELLASIRELTNHYQFPENACTNHRVIFNKLREFDNDLVQHKHLEMNVLFPKAIEEERALLNLEVAG
jgi:regulator of cell morphogenesis and NO signaling